MRIIKILAVLILILLAAFFIISATAPKNYKVSRSKTIAAPASVVFNMVSKYNNWSMWSPWKERDAKASYSLEGEDGVVGSKYNWKDGDPEITGVGSITSTEINPNKKFAYLLSFKEPYEMSSNGYFELKSLDSMHTELTWVDQGDIPFMQRAILKLFFNMDEMLGKDFDRGLFKIDSLAKVQITTLQVPE